MYSAAVVQESLPRRREPRRWTVQGLAIRSWQPPAERIIRADPLVVTGEAAEELNANHSMLIRYLKQTGKVKKLKKWMTHMLCAKSLQSDSEIQRTLAHQVPHGNRASWAKARKKKNPKTLKCPSPLIVHNNEPFLDQIVTCDQLYDNRWWPAQCKAKSAPKRGHDSHCLVVCYLSNPLQLSESQQNHDIWKACSAN